MSDSTMPKGQYYYGVGRRKSAVARVRLYPGEGNFTVNGKPVREHFGGRELHYLIMAEPFRATGTTERFFRPSRRHPAWYFPCPHQR
jgi:small subunit ribosomal protein S9